MREMMKGLGMKKSVGVDGDPETDADRNWNSERRLREQEADGWVARSDLPQHAAAVRAASRAASSKRRRSVDDVEHRWAGLRAHNRWLADYVSLAPERRAGCAQIFLGDVEGSVAEIEWAAEHGLRGGIVLPGAPPGSGFLPLYARRVRAHLGGVRSQRDAGQPPQWRRHPRFRHAPARVRPRCSCSRSPGGRTARCGTSSSRACSSATPNLHFCNTESGTKWILDTLPELDSFYDRMKYGHGSEVFFGGAATKDMSLRPSEYWRRQCHVGASFLRPLECDLRHDSRDREHHVGRRLPAQRRLAAVHAGAPAAHVRRGARRPRSSRSSR